jgi:hypothetical protein
MSLGDEVFGQKTGAKETISLPVTWQRLSNRDQPDVHRLILH